MPTILALTVGGSPAPVITAARDYQPAHVCFIATSGSKGSRPTVDGPGRPCRTDAGDAPNIVTQLGLTPDQFRVVELDDPDDLPAIYAVCRETLRALAAEFPAARRIADYTGGSKSMGVGLALAALEGGWELSLVRGQRTDLVKVTDGTEMAGLVNSWEVRARQQLDEARRLFNAYAYASAGELLAGLLRQAPVSPDLERTIREWVTLCRGFDAWDRFAHAEAARILSTVQAHIVPQWRFLKTLTGQARATGYEPVLDLMRNAERRAARGRYDDAVARLYRAIELLAQTRLRQRDPALDSGDLDLAKLPADIRPRYERGRDAHDGRIKLGLAQDYTLLADLDDPLGRVWRSLEGQVLNAIQRRNQSILAHGLDPLNRAGYEEMRAAADRLIQGHLAALNLSLTAPQFPSLEAAADGQPPTED